MTRFLSRHRGIFNKCKSAALQQIDILHSVHIRLPILSTVCLFALSVLVGTTVQAQQSCSVAPALGIPTAAHLFSTQLERALGDGEAEWVETSNRAVHDDGLASHLNHVASRILSQFPPEQARVRVILLDALGANPFSVAPERIYITRKMVARRNNDDELAGLVEHELGHILMHENAIIVSR